MFALLALHAPFAQAATYEVTEPTILNYMDLTALLSTYVEKTYDLFDAETGEFSVENGAWQPRTAAVFLREGRETRHPRYANAVEQAVAALNESSFDVSTLSLSDLAHTHRVLVQMNGSEVDVSDIADAVRTELLSRYDETEGAFIDETLTVDTEDGQQEVSVIRAQSSADVALALLEEYRVQNDEEAARRLNRTLGYVFRNMVDKSGVWSSVRSDGLKGDFGAIADTGPLLVVASQAYEETKNPFYFTGAIRLANFAIERAYDWKSGVFLASDPENAADGDDAPWQVLHENNATMSLGLLRMYDISGDTRYLSAGAKSLGKATEQIPPADEGAVFYDVMRYAINNNIMSDFASKEAEVNQADKDGFQKFVVLHPKTAIVFTSAEVKAPEPEKQSARRQQPVNRSTIFLSVIAVAAMFALKKALRS